jgi:hypothetical protein
MPVRFTDEEIAALIAERKPLPADRRSRMRLSEKRGNREWQVDLTGAEGDAFRIILRQNTNDRLNFSAILAHCPPAGSRDFRLRRYNGSDQHTNPIEGTSLRGCHIHEATERCQAQGPAEDHYAEATARYSELDGALACLIGDCGFEVEAGPQLSLFEEVQQ